MKPTRVLLADDHALAVTDDDAPVLVVAVDLQPWSPAPHHSVHGSR